MQLTPPKPLPHQVLVRIKAAAFNPADLHIASGEMKMMSPIKPPFVLGVEGAGVVEALGKSVLNWKVGEEVFFYTGLVHSGTMAEYIAVDAAALAPKPAHWRFDQAAASALALLCANLALARAQVKAGQRVLIHGGGGGVGSAALRLAQERGAITDTTANHHDFEYLKSLGATTLYDYQKTPLNDLPHSTYDMVLDGMGGEVFMQSLPLLKPGGTIVSLKVMTDFKDMLRMGMQPPGIIKLLMPLMFRKYTKAAAQAKVRLKGVATFSDGDTLNQLGQKMQALQYIPRIAQTFSLDEAQQALRYFAQGNTRGKVVIEI